MLTTILCDSDTDHDNRNVKFLLHYKALASYTTHSQVAEMYSESHKETQEQRLIQLITEEKMSLISSMCKTTRGLLARR